jgi:murein DD-endopeptidase MepM/ murein hydrolase activator NlpD
VQEVLETAKLFGDAGVDAVFTLDRLQVSLDEARTRVAGAAEALKRARMRLRARERHAYRLGERADAAPVLSNRLSLEQRAVYAELAVRAARRTVRHAQRRLAGAREGLEQARLQAQAPSFSPGTSALLGSPSYDGGYVFPVGGGPASVSVSHDHHDYAAADIAAPEGAPVYALADAVVESTVSDGRCGTGAIIRTADGLEWVYCHLSYLDPAIQSGAVLSAGGFMGLVGSTGHATGPHLHLQLEGATAWPQQQSWFQEFAGTAFRWQDEPTQLPPGGSAVFAEIRGSTDRVVLFSR